MTEREILKTLVPLNALSPANLADLAARTSIDKIPAGQTIFNLGDTDTAALYLLAGSVTLKSETSSVERVIASGSDEARYALAQLKPRQYHGVAQTDVTIARVDSERLDRLITLEQAAQASGYEVVEFDGSEDGEWMLRLLRQEAFQKLPPANINLLFTRMQPIEVKAGQIIIKQGDPGDFYYLIKQGRANVSRKAESNKVIVLNELGEGEGFGEEALLSGAPRNATVIMRTAGVLMRLNPADFNALLKAPLVKSLSPAEARTLAQAGAGFLDVRTEDEFRQGAIKGSINLPLYLLRMKAASLDAKRPYIACCQTGNRSTAAAFLLSQRGFDVYVLQGGLNALG
jgi:CRP-like cAMP-binding protein